MAGYLDEAGVRTMWRKVCQLGAYNLGTFSSAGQAEQAASLINYLLQVKPAVSTFSVNGVGMGFILTTLNTAARTGRQWIYWDGSIKERSIFWNEDLSHAQGSPTQWNTTVAHRMELWHENEHAAAPSLVLLDVERTVVSEIPLTALADAGGLATAGNLSLSLGADNRLDLSVGGTVADSVDLSTLSVEGGGGGEDLPRVILRGAQWVDKYRVEVSPEGPQKDPLHTGLLTSSSIIGEKFTGSARAVSLSTATQTNNFELPAFREAEFPDGTGTKYAVQLFYVCEFDRDRMEMTEKRYTFLLVEYHAAEGRVNRTFYEHWDDFPQTGGGTFLANEGDLTESFFTAAGRKATRARAGVLWSPDGVRVFKVRPDADVDPESPVQTGLPAGTDTLYLAAPSAAQTADAAPCGVYDLGEFAQSKDGENAARAHALLTGENPAIMTYGIASGNKGLIISSVDKANRKAYQWLFLQGKNYFRTPTWTAAGAVTDPAWVPAIAHTLSLRTANPALELKSHDGRVMSTVTVESMANAAGLVRTAQLTAATDRIAALEERVAALESQLANTGEV